MKKPRIRATDREVAVAVLKAMAESPRHDGRFSPRGMYDDDAGTVELIMEHLGDKVDKGLSWEYTWRRLMRVCNSMQDFGVIAGRVYTNPDRQYIGEEVRQKEFWFSKSYAPRIRPDLHPHYTPMPSFTPDCEIDWLLRHAYPKEDL